MANADVLCTIESIPISLPAKTPRPMPVSTTILTPSLSQACKRSLTICIKSPNKRSCSNLPSGRDFLRLKSLSLANAGLSPLESISYISFQFDT